MVLGVVPKPDDDDPKADSEHTLAPPKMEDDGTLPPKVELDVVPPKTDGETVAGVPKVPEAVVVVVAGVPKTDVDVVVEVRPKGELEAAVAVPP